MEPAYAQANKAKDSEAAARAKTAKMHSNAVAALDARIQVPSTPAVKTTRSRRGQGNRKAWATGAVMLLASTAAVSPDTTTASKLHSELWQGIKDDSFYNTVVLHDPLLGGRPREAPSPELGGKRENGLYFRRRRHLRGLVQ